VIALGARPSTAQTALGAIEACLPACSIVERYAAKRSERRAHHSATGRDFELSEREHHVYTHIHVHDSNDDTHIRLHTHYTLSHINTNVDVWIRRRKMRRMTQSPKKTFRLFI